MGWVKLPYGSQTEGIIFNAIISALINIITYKIIFLKASKQVNENLIVQKRINYLSQCLIMKNFTFQICFVHRGLVSISMNIQVLKFIIPFFL